jgi:chemosensory pili system protein ChpE
VGAALSLTSPSNVAFWASAAAAVGSAVGVTPSPAALTVFFLGFFLASLLWCWASAAVIALIRRSASTRVIRVIDGGCGLALIALGGWSVVAV